MDWKYFSHQMNPSPAEIGAPYKVPNTFHTGISTQAGTIPYLKKKMDMGVRSYTGVNYSPGSSDLTTLYLGNSGHCFLQLALNRSRNRSTINKAKERCSL